MNRGGGQSRKNSGVADDDWDATEADSLSDPLTEWDFGNIDVSETAPRRTGSGADRYTMEDQQTADNDLSGEHSWDDEFGSHPAPAVGPNGQRMQPRVAQPPMPQSRNQGSYQQFPPSGSAPNPMMPYPGNGRNGRNAPSQPIQGRPQAQPAPMGQQSMGQMRQTQPMRQPQPSQQPMGQMRQPQPMYPPTHPQQMGQMGQMRQPQPSQQRMGYPPQGQMMMPPQPQQRVNPQMGRGRSGGFLPQSEFNNGSYHRPQGY